MMKIRKHILTILLFVTIILLQANSMLLKNKQSVLELNFRNKVTQDSIDISELSGRISLMYRNDEFEVNKESILTKEDGNSIRLKDIAFDTHIFVVRFSEFSCMNCITSEMKKIAQYEQLNKNMLCLATYSQLHDLLINKKIMGLSNPVYNIPFETFKNSMEKKRMPYYFILDKDYQVRHLFVAEPNNHELTNKYLSFIASLFDSNNSITGRL